MTFIECYLFDFHLQYTCFFIMSPSNKFMNQIIVSVLRLVFLILTWVSRGGPPLSAHTWPGPSPAWPPACLGSSSLSPSPELEIWYFILTLDTCTWSLIFIVPITLMRSLWDFFLAEFNRAWKWECLFWKEAEILESVLKIKKIAGDHEDLNIYLLLLLPMASFALEEMLPLPELDFFFLNFLL